MYHRSRSVRSSSKELPTNNWTGEEIDPPPVSEESSIKPRSRLGPWSDATISRVPIICESSFVYTHIVLITIYIISTVVILTTLYCLFVADFNFKNESILRRFAKFHNISRFNVDQRLRRMKQFSGAALLKQLRSNLCLTAVYAWMVWKLFFANFDIERLKKTQDSYHPKFNPFGSFPIATGINNINMVVCRRSFLI